MYRFQSLIAAASLMAAAANAYDLKGIEIDQVPNEGQVKASLGIDSIEPNKCHMGFAHVNDMPVHSVLCLDGAQRAKSITFKFKPIFFDDLAKLALAKWGKPTITDVHEEQTAFGARVSVITYQWNLMDGSVAWICNYFGSLDEGDVELDRAK